MVIKMTIISKKLIKIYLLFFFTIVSCIACDFGHKSEINVSTSSSPIIKNLKEMLSIFLVIILLIWKHIYLIMLIV